MGRRTIGRSGLQPSNVWTRNLPHASAHQGGPTPDAATASPPITFAVLIFHGFPMMAFSSVIEPLRAANILAHCTCYRWITVGLSGGKVEASNGVSIEPVQAVHDAPMVDRIVVCSGGDADHLVADVKRQTVEAVATAFLKEQGLI